MENNVVSKVAEAQRKKDYITDKNLETKRPFVISLSTLVKIVLFSSMLLFVLLLMFVETANML